MLIWIGPLPRLVMRYQSGGLLTSDWRFLVLLHGMLLFMLGITSSLPNSSLLRFASHLATLLRYPGRKLRRPTGPGYQQRPHHAPHTRHEAGVLMGLQAVLGEEPCPVVAAVRPALRMATEGSVVLCTAWPEGQPPQECRR